MKTKGFYLLIVLFFLFLFGCAARIEKPIKPAFPLILIKADDFPSFSDDLDQKSLELAIGRSLQYYDRLPEGRTFRFGKSLYMVRELKESLLEFLEIIRSSDADEIRERRIRDTFDVYRSAGCGEKRRILFTGYYEPILEGSFRRTPKYRYPVYRKPGDSMVINLGRFREKFKGERIVARLENGEIVPYHSREDIDEKGHLKDRNLEIAWFADPVDIFFLHIQGSGIIQLPDGGYVQVSYAMSNGRPYRSVGKLLIDTGRISREDVSLGSIRKYLKDHPEEVSDILNYNESYVFFRIVEKGPVGCLGVPVTSGRSIATDSKLYPKGALAFIRTKKPLLDENGNIKSWISFSRFVLNQDTGGVIKGPGRVDLFCGKGSYAEIMAGSLKEEGEMYFLVKKRR
ncbi:MAG: MltA domain-containing protein [Thermodesulfobacteriota bacterium]|nr:MltA domain-containing protein [Thermodesulfobacteriota bacterium]